MTALIVTSVIAAVLAVFFIFVRVTQKPIYGLMAKILPSVGFIVIGITALTMYGNNAPYGAPLIVLGLVFGLIGDIVLDAKRVHPDFNDQYLTTGMLSFISGHIVFLVAVFLIALKSTSDLRIDDILLPVLVSLGIGVLMGPITIIVSEKFLKADFKKHRIISGVYGSFLIFFTVFTLWLTIKNSNYALFFAGMLAFLLSDLVLSQMYFVEGKQEDKVLVAVNHALYYAAQILIACFLFTICFVKVS